MATRKPIKKNKNKKMINRETTSIGIIGIGFVLILCVFTKMGSGSIGGVLRNLCIGFFGIGGLVFPILLLGLGIYLFLKKNLVNIKNIILITCIFFIFISFFHVISGNDFSHATLQANIITKSYTSATDFNGGMFGGILGYIFQSLLGSIITGIVFSILIILCLILLTGKSLSDIFSNAFDSITTKINSNMETDEYEDVSKEEEVKIINKNIKTDQRENNIIKNKYDLKIRKDALSNKRIRPPSKAKVVNMRRDGAKVKKGDLNLIDVNNFPKSEDIFVEDSFEINEDFNYKNNNINVNENEPTENNDSNEIKLTDYNDLNEVNNIEENISEVQVNNENLKLVETLKEELRRQSYLTQETQHELMEQKKIERSLLKIINAQRETIEKISNQTQSQSNINENKIESIQPENEIFTETEKLYENYDENLFEGFDFNFINQSENVSSNQTSENVISNQTNENNISKNELESLMVSNNLSQDDLDNLEKVSLANKSLSASENNLNSNVNEVSEKFKNSQSTNEISSNEQILSNKQPSTTYATTVFKEDDKFTSFDNNYNEVKDEPVPEKYVYNFPTVDFLNPKPAVAGNVHSKTELLENSKKLEATLKTFGVVAKVIEVNKGPTVTRYEILPAPGVKVNKIVNLSDDLALHLSAKSIRIQAPIPGKGAVGIEVPNEKTETVYLREVLADENFRNFQSKLAFGIGKDVAGKIVVADIAEMPHLLIAGATGAGKSVCINTLVTSIIYKSSPEEVKLIMVDPKVVELSMYNGIPHLLIPVVTDPKKASAALHWAVREMDRRYNLFADNNVKELRRYNENLSKTGQDGLEPQIVIIIDELADLMMTAAKEVEDAILRLSAKARAAGIHLILATQRPSVDVITGVIKANIPSRLAFAVSSGVDSKTILDTVGAEKLIGKGDMLFYPRGYDEPVRIQGAFISDKEVENIVTFLKANANINNDYTREIIEEITSVGTGTTNISSDKVDEILEEVVEFIIERQKASTSLIQRQFRVGFNRAARIVEELENFGVIGHEDGNKPRKVLMTMQEWDNKFKV